MKHFYSLIIVTAIVTLIASGKDACAQQTDNYYSIRDNWNAFFNSHPELKSEKDGEYQQFIRWQEFWRYRVDNTDSALSGNLSNLSNAYNHYYQSQSYQNSSVNPSPWSFCGPLNVSGQHNGLVSAIYVDTLSSGYPDYRTIYAGTNASGIWKTTDGGQNWVNITDASGLYCIGINDIKGDPTNSNKLYAATGGGGIFSGTPFGIGIIHSTDAGATWSPIYSVNPSQGIISYYILIDPTDTNRLYAGVGEKLLRLEWNGNTWISTTLFENTSDTVRNIRDIEMKPGCPDTLYISTDSRGGQRSAQILRITGATTNNFSHQLLHPFSNDTLSAERFEIAVNPLTPKSIYVIGQHYIQKHNHSADSIIYVAIWKSIDNGITWELKYRQDQTSYGGVGLLAFGAVGYYKMELQISPTDTSVLYIGGNTISRVYQTTGTWSIAKTTNYGENAYHPDTRAAVILHGSDVSTNGINDILICGNDGGVSRTNNGINTWTNINGNGLWITEFWGMGSSEKYPYWIGGGTADNGFYVNLYGPWLITKGGEDASGTLVDFGLPNIVYLNSMDNSSTGFVTQISTDFGATFPGACHPTNSEQCLYNKPLVLNPKNSNIMYSGAYNLYRNNNMHTHPENFTKISVNLNQGATIDINEKINRLAIPESDTNTILFSYEGFHGNSANRKHKLILTHDRGATFIDLLASSGNGVLLSWLTWRPITSILISPIDMQKMWVTVGGFSGIVGQGKVFYSSDGGNSFTDISTDLPDFPVNCISYWGGGDDRIFIGTDVGVFYKDNTLNSWQAYNQGLPISMITDLEILPNVEILRASTYGRGIWQTYLHPCVTVYDSTENITTNETWVTPRDMDRSILVKAPDTLTIKTRVRFPNMTKIMVEPGATLVCDSGCDLTNLCRDMWLGIEVWGNSSAQQTSANQGVVYFKNGAILENARIGITTCRKDTSGNIDWSTTGGMIHAVNNSTFRNNFKSIEFLTYPYMQHSAFRNVFFETTSPFCDLTSNPQAFVSLFNIKNLRFDACSFINSRRDSNLIPDPTNGLGITSIDAIYSVVGTCKGPIYPCPEWTPSTFIGLFYGIKAENSDPSNPVIIDKVLFADNHRGAYLSGVNFAQVTSTEFNYPPLYLALPSGDTIYGLYLNSSTGYKVQENLFHYKFHTPLGFLKRFIGIVVNNSGPDPNEIYNNTFDTLGIGILAQRFNRSRDGSTGLCLKCNDFDSTRYDQAITYPNPPFSTPWGISAYQGSDFDVTSPAGNVFSRNHRLSTSNGLSDIMNDGGRINYFFHEFWPPNVRIYPDYRSTNVSVFPALGKTYIKSEACPSKLNDSIPNHDQMKADFSNENAQVSSLKNQLFALIDGGNTEATAMDINFSIPPEALELHDELLSKSPYLSDTVMKSAIIKEDVLPNEMIRDILVANPQSAKSDSVLNELDNRFVQMPETMMDEILEGKDILGSKENLEAQLAEHQLKETYFFNELVRFYKQDTLDAWVQDSLLVLLQNRNTLSAKYMLAFEYLKRDENENVTQVLNNISSQFEFSTTEQQQYEDYNNYFQVIMDLKSQNLTIFDINTDQQNQLMELAVQGSEPVQTYARNILLANNLISYQEPIDLPDETKSTPTGKEPKPTKSFKDGSLKLYPNPAMQYVIVDYNFTDQVSSLESMVLTIISGDGKTVDQRNIVKPQDQLLIDCRKLNSGSYICKMACGKKTLGLGKFIISK